MALHKIDTVKPEEYMKQMFAFRLYTNYFGQAFAEGDLYVSTDHSFILVKPQEGFSRLFVASDDREDLVKLLRSMEGVNVLNIPSKGDISKWQQLMSDAGYENIGIYERFVYQKFRTGIGLDSIIYAQVKDLEEIYHLYCGYEGFTPYTDYLPSRAELKQFIENDYVLVNKIDNKISGVHIFSIKGKKCDLRLLIDVNNEGLKLLFDMFEIVHSEGVTSAVGWVNTENIKAKTIYQLMGAQMDGLKDYTFIKK